MQFSGFAVSVRGASHEDSGTPCQDSARVLITDKLAVAAVSDGHGSEKHFRSASGSEMAARVALRSVTDFCERNGSLGAVFLTTQGRRLGVSPGTSYAAGTMKLPRTCGFLR